MPNSKINKLIAIIQDAIKNTMAKEAHLTPTLNDIYDSFNKLGLRIDRSQNNSSEILKMLKNKDYKEWSRFIKQLLQVYKNQHEG